MPGPDVRLFVLADEQGETGRDVRPVFESPEHKKCSGLSKLCFPLREIFSVTKTACPQGGGKLLRSRRFLQGTPCAETEFNRRRVSGTLRSKMGSLEGIIASYRQKKRSRLSKAAPTNGDIMFRFSDENHTGFLTVIARYDEHSMACFISNRGRDTPLSSYSKTKELAATMAFSHAQFHRNSVKYYHALTEVKTLFLARNAPAKCHNKICNATTLLLQR